MGFRRVEHAVIQLCKRRKLNQVGRVAVIEGRVHVEGIAVAVRGNEQHLVEGFQQLLTPGMFHYQVAAGGDVNPMVGPVENVGGAGCRLHGWVGCRGRGRRRGRGMVQVHMHMDLWGRVRRLGCVLRRDQRPWCGLLRRRVLACFFGNRTRQAVDEGCGGGGEQAGKSQGQLGNDL